MWMPSARRECRGYCEITVEASVRSAVLPIHLIYLRRRFAVGHLTML